MGVLYFNSRTAVVEKTTSASSETHVELKRGPHRGKLLQKNDFQVEVTIFEPQGIPPKFRIYFYDKGDPVNPAEVQFAMQLQRINRLEEIPFKQIDGYLESTLEASEPHSFEVIITANFKDQTYHWEYASYEGRVELSQEMIKANGIKIEKAGPINLEILLNVMGKIVPNEERTVYISPRFPGLVKAVNKKLGDLVSKGEILAVIESNESLNDYEIKSEIDGMIIKKNINVGMYLTGQESVFVVSDLNSVWADLNIYRKDLQRIKNEDPVQITSLDGAFDQQATVSYISPVGNEMTQSVIARVVLQNAQQIWKPGLFVSGKITIESVYVPLAVKKEALQKFRDWDVVFINIGNLFEVVPVQVGISNNEWVEIKSGLKAEDFYVSENSFILKADLEKSGAKHDH